MMIFTGQTLLSGTQIPNYTLPLPTVMYSSNPAQESDIGQQLRLADTSSGDDLGVL
jgi:hypothetical protein